MSDAMMNIGTRVDKGGMEAMGSAIVAIMQAHDNPDIIRAGLDALTRVVKVEHVSISDCTFHHDSAHAAARVENAE